MNKDVIIIADYTYEESLSLDEVIELFHVAPEFMHELVSIGVIQPHNNMLNANQLVRIKRAQRLQRELEVNLAGVAVVLDLLDDLEKMRARLAFLEKHLHDENE